MTDDPECGSTPPPASAPPMPTPRTVTILGPLARKVHPAAANSPNGPDADEPK